MMKNNEKNLGADAAAVESDTTAASPKLTHVELDPVIWNRGDANTSKLLTEINGQRRQCCLGIAATQLGVNDDDIRGRGTVGSVWECLPKVLQLELSIAGGIYSINDTGAPYTSDVDRVDSLNEHLSRMGVPLRFSLKAEAHS